MLNQHVIDYINSAYALIKGLPLSLFAAAFAIYFAYMKITNKIAFSYSYTFRDSGDKLTDFILRNKRDKTYSIKKIICTLSDGNTLMLRDFHPPLLIKPFETTLVDFDEVSLWRDKEGNEYKPDYMEIFEISVLLHGGGSVKCIRQFHSDYKEPTITPFTSKLDDLILTHRMKFILRVSINSEIKTIVIYDHGWVDGSEFFGGYNSLEPEDVCLDKIVNIIHTKKFSSIWASYVIFEVNYFRPNRVYDSRMEGQKE